MKLVLDALEFRPILFHGLGFEIGQDKRGLARSPAHFRSYFRELRELGLAITDSGTLHVPIGEEPVKVFSEEQLSALDWSVGTGGANLSHGHALPHCASALSHCASALSVETPEVRRPSLRRTPGGSRAS
jgi:hypothetical protein